MGEEEAKEKEIQTGIMDTDGVKEVQDLRA